MFKKFAKINKRRRFLLSSFILTIFVLISSFIPYGQIWLYLIGLSLLVYGFTYFSILQDIERGEWIMLFIIPFLFTIASVLFYVLIPGRWITRLPFMLFYSISIYAILLSQNIFNVGVELNLQLYRAAYSINFLFNTIIAYLLTQYLMSFRFGPFLSTIGSMLIIYPLALHVFWAVNPKVYISKELYKYAGYVVILAGQVIYVFSYLPIRTEIRALVVSACFYSFAGLVYLHIERMIMTTRIREYIIVLVFIILLALLSAQW